MSLIALREQLRSLTFLQGLTDTAIHQLSVHVQPTTYEGDALLFSEGSPRAILAILLSGAVAIEKNVNGRPVRLVTLGPGEAVGEGILLDDLPHGTSARVIQPAQAFVLGRDQVQSILKDQPQLYAALVARAARTISRRLAATDATLAGRGRVSGFGGAQTRQERDL